MSLFSVKLVNYFSLIEISAFSIIMVLKIIEKINPKENIKKLIKIVIKKFDLDK